MSRIDHLVYGVPDLAAGAEDLERRLGVRPAPGGRHPGRGTHNALLALGARCYLEVIAPDPSQPDPPAGRMDGARRPRMDGVIPFLIDWGASAHPAESGPGGLRLAHLRVQHPDAARANAVLEALGLDLRVEPGVRPRLVARLATPRGAIDLA